MSRLADYTGTVLLVSHDRDFLDRVVTSTIAAEDNARWIEYAGGYTDMLAQRAAAHRRSPPPVALRKQPRPTKVTRARSSARPPRMSFQDRHALETLLTRIAALQTKVAELNELLADPNLYARDHRQFGKRPRRSPSRGRRWQQPKNGG